MHFELFPLLEYAAEFWEQSNDTNVWKFTSNRWIIRMWEALIYGVIGNCVILKLFKSSWEKIIFYL